MARELGTLAKKNAHEIVSVSVHEIGLDRNEATADLKVFGVESNGPSSVTGMRYRVQIGDNLAERFAKLIRCDVVAISKMKP
jgi:hypothetical protein